MPKGLRKFKFLFEKPGLTRWGGISLFVQFCKSLRLRHFLQHHVRWPRYHHRECHPCDLFLAHLFAIVAGIGRIENTQSLLHNGLIPPILGFPESPHRDTLRTFLWRFNKKSLQSLQAAHDKIRTEFFQRLGILYSATMDCDTTTLTVFGHQESVEVGYNRKYRGSAPMPPSFPAKARAGFPWGWSCVPAT
ncbi:MAG: transposase [Elusimicrobia bacterium]|nr:transposase [Elusimicrobiota bacterium]